MKTEFIPVDYDYFDHNGRNYAKIYGRDENGNKICVIDDCPVYLWAILKEDLSDDEIQNIIDHAKSIELDEKGRQTKVEKVELLNKRFLGKDVRALKIHATNYKDLPGIANNLGIEGIDKRRGYDLGFVTHYINESELYPSVWYEIEYSSSSEFELNIDCEKVVKLVSKTKIDRTEWEPKTLAFDIETDSLNPNDGAMLMFSLAGSCGYEKVVSWKKAATSKKYVEIVEDEKALLKRFVELVKEYSPDFIVGYNSDWFDMNYIKERAKINRVKLPIGLDGSNLSTTRGQTPITKISGIVHIDLIKFIRNMYSQYMKSETLKLNDVAKEFLGDTKTDFELKHSGKIMDEEWDKYYEYNLQDSVLTLNLFNKFLTDLIEFSRIIKEPTFKISRNGLAKQIEQYIIHNLDKFNEIPERRPGYNETNIRKGMAGIEGAFVYEPKPGLYSNLAMFDFTSMHTSIIITHNISGATLTDDKENSFESPEIETRGGLKKYYFKKELGVFPTLMKTIFEKRKQYKKEYQENPNEITKARSNAFKVLSASAHGYIGFFGSRYYSWEASSSILAFVRKYNMGIIEKIKAAGHNVVYGDTDSVVFTREEKSKEEVINLLEKLNSELPGVMHLELEGFFKRGLWVSTRGGETGAKKKYAMVNENGETKIRGFETVRRDWCPLARNTQKKVLNMVLDDGNGDAALEYVKTIIKKIKDRTLDKKDLTIKSKIKRPLHEYKAIGPHVIAARKMKDRGEEVGEGTLVEYFIGKGTGTLVRDKTFLMDEDVEYDEKYYLEKQLLPAVDSILHVFGIDIKDEIDGRKQEKLGRWF